jgi:uncharacterized protein (TIGR02099 family)
MRRLWRLLAGTIALVVVLAALLVGLLRLALVQVPEYRDQIQAWAGEALGSPVEVASMDARLGLRGPELSFTGARILAPDGERTLVVASGGSIQLDALSLLRGRPRVGRLTLAGVSLRVERGETANWRLLGEEGPALGEDAGKLPRLAELPPIRVRLEDLRVEVEDLRRALGPWSFQVDTLDLELAGGRLVAAASGVLPEALGAALSLSLEVDSQDERGYPRDWRAGISTSALDLAAIGEAIGREEWLPAAGVVDGNLSLLADGSHLQRIAGDLRARALLLPPRPGAAPELSTEPYHRLAATLEWQRTGDGWRARVADLDVARAGRSWQSPGVAFDLAADTQGRRVGVQADLLQLDDLQPLAPWLPPGVRAVVDQLAPTGTLREFDARLELPSDEEAPPEVRVATRFEDLSIRAGPRSPGIRHLSGTVAGDGRSGRAQLSGQDLALEMPWLFREPLVLEAAQAELEWRQDGDGLELRIPDFSGHNPDAFVIARGAVAIPADGGTPQLEFEGLVRDVDVTAGPRYLPVGIMPPKIVEWLDEALRAGRAPEAHFELRGPTRGFPYRDGQGLFRVEFDMVDASLDFAPGWPVATDIGGRVRFENEGLWAELSGARLQGLEAGPVAVAIPDLAEGRLSIQGEAHGALAQFREFVLATERLENLLGPGLAPAEIIAGKAEAEVDLLLPLKSIADYRAQIELDFRDGVVAYGFLGAPIADLNGRLSIDNALVAGRDITATLADTPVTAEVSVLEDGAVRIAGGGRTSLAAASQLLRMPFGHWAAGETDWTGHLQFPAPGSPGPLQFEIRSRLEGVEIALPEPLGKTPEAARSLRVGATFPGDDLMDLEIDWEGSLRMAARMDRSGPELVFAAAPGAPDGAPPGLFLSGTVARLDLGAWLGLELPADVEAGGLAGSVAAARLLIGELDAPGLRVGDLLVELSRGTDRWRVELSGDRAAGRLELPFILYGAEPVTVRMDRLWFGAGRSGAEASDPPEAEGLQEEPPSRLHPALVPALDLEIDDVRYGDIRFGSISARVLHEGDGIELIGLEGIGEGFMFQAEGRSRLSDAVDVSRLAVKVRSEDVGATLGFMGFRRSMEAKDGRFDAEVTWQGGLRGDWLAAIEGNARISVGEGALVGVEPGAGRVFGLLSIEALPRRLALDFKDVFGEGTSFDRISGDFRLTGGDAYTENLVMRGPAVDIGVVGRTGLVARDYDQTAVIGADFGRALPVAGTVVGGPAVGAALFLLSEMLRKPFQAQITYRLTGPWDNPVVERLSAGANGERGGRRQ